MAGAAAAGDPILLFGADFETLMGEQDGVRPVPAGLASDAAFANFYCVVQGNLRGELHPHRHGQGGSGDIGTSATAREDAQAWHRVQVCLRVSGRGASLRALVLQSQASGSTAQPSQPVSFRLGANIVAHLSTRTGGGEQAQAVGPHDSERCLHGLTRRGEVEDDSMTYMFQVGGRVVEGTALGYKLVLVLTGEAWLGRVLWLGN